MSDIYVSRSARLAARKVAGEMIILSADDSSLFVLNEVGTAIWEAADGRTTLGSIVQGVICGHYDVDAETGLKDAHEFVERLAHHRLLELSPEPAK